ncbi:PilC/PilY family type IV pilus protein [Candidatus Pelagibacter bacterium]|nr:PilC/PilY family type IV pilus protein [Candidatus Pelagibacter bacterium]
MARLSTVIIFLFLFSFQAQAKSPPPGTGTTDIPANILIMLDKSGSMRDALASNTVTQYPIDVAADSSGNVYVLEYANNRIKVFDSAGTFLRSFGGYGSGCNQWKYARQFTIFNDQVYLADHQGNRVLKLSLTGQCIGSGLTYFTKPFGIAVNSNYVFVGNYGNTIETLATGNLARTGYQNVAGGVNLSIGMSLNSAGNKLIVASFFNHKVFEFTVSGNNLTYVNAAGTSQSSANGSFNRPVDAAYDSSGNIYVVERDNDRIQKFNSSLVYQAKQGSFSRTSAFYNPYGMFIDSSDNIYVADFTNQTTRKFNTSLSQTATFGGKSGTKLSSAKKVIKQIVSDTNLTAGANFGLMEWSSSANIRVGITNNGARFIYSNVDGISANGGTNLAKAMRTARDYFRSGVVDNWDLTCSLNFLIVISDGYWQSNNQVVTVANQIRKVDNIQTFAVGYALGGSNSNYSSLATAGGTTNPLYAENETELLAKITDAIKQAISGRLTFTTPAVMSDVSRNNFIYQSTFEYETDKQWKGSLKKYQLNTDGTFGSAQWDAADKLNSKTSSTRNIWTPVIGTGLNNFTTANRDLLKSKMFPNITPTDTEVDNLINFIRGIDTYDQDADNNKTESIHKLADIYHSDLIVVANPEASAVDDNTANFQKKDSYYRLQNNYNNFKSGATCGGPCANRAEIIYAGANNGILHAFKASDGEELWGYIPPNVLGVLEKIPSSKANSTNAIYGIDGSPVAKDIYFDDTPNDGVDNPRWRTILLSGLGAGGKGMFALDITDPNSPTHLFAFNNDETNKFVEHWDANASKFEFGYVGGNIAPEYDYRKLGETWSTPRIIRIKVDGKDRWVAVFGGGYNGGVNPNVGSAVFVIDLENEGKVLKVINIKTQAAQIINTWRTFIGSSHSFLLNNRTELDISRLFPNLTFDLSKGESVKVETTNSLQPILSFSGTGDVKTVTKASFPTWRPGYIIISKMKVDIANSLPADLSVITADGTNKANYNGALIYATDLEGKITKIDLTENFVMDTDQNSPTYNSIIRSDVSDKEIHQTTLFTAEATSANGRNIFTRPEVTINSDNNLWLYFGTGNTQKLQAQSSQIQNRIYGIKDVNFPNFVEVNPTGNVSMCKTAPTCPSGTDLGWYVNLDNAKKLTAEPTVDRDRVYFPLYEPSSTNNKCGVGNAYFTAYDTKCGNSLLNVNMGKGVLSKVVKQGDNLYIGLAGEAKDNIDGFTAKDNLITGKSKAQEISGAVQLESWKENY